MTERDNNGRFAKGNRGGPGRPRRHVESEYLAALSDTVTMDSWKQVCQRAVEDAINGDSKAREWLTKHMVGDGQRITRLAAAEHWGWSSDHDVHQKANQQCLSKAAMLPDAMPDLHPDFGIDRGITDDEIDELIFAAEKTLEVDKNSRPALTCDDNLGA